MQDSKTGWLLIVVGLLLFCMSFAWQVHYSLLEDRILDLHDPYALPSGIMMILGIIVIFRGRKRKPWLKAEFLDTSIGSVTKNFRADETLNPVPNNRRADQEDSPHHWR
jgi:vacuolar-type H+-ATPase subunit I/STV1